MPLMDEKEKERLVAEKKGRRTILRSNLTKMSNSLEAQRNKEVDQDRYALQIFNLEKEIEAYNELMSELMDLDVEEDGPQIKEAQNVIFMANRYLKRLESKSDDDSKSSGENSAVGSCEAAACASGSAFKYKVDELPVFSGSYEEFPEWWSQWKIVDSESETRLPKVKKFLLLKKCLKGKAYDEIIQKKRTTAENYDVVIKELKETYGDPLHQISLFSQRLFRTPKASFQANSLRSVVSYFESSFRELLLWFDESEDLESNECEEACETCVPCHTCDEKRSKREKDRLNVILTPRLLESLPDQLVTLWMRKCDERPRDVFDFESLTNFIKREIKNISFNNDEPPRRVATNHSMHSSTSDCCKFCKMSNHSLNKCRKFKLISPSERKQNARKFGWCFKCLEGGHMIEQCKSKIKCAKEECQSPENHNTILHTKRDEERKNPTETTTSNPPGLTTSGPPPQFQQGRSTPPVVTTAQASNRHYQATHQERKGEKILLQTAIVDVTKPDGSGPWRRVKILLDSGATRTYIRRDLANTLGLPIRDTGFFNTFVWGEIETGVTKYDKIELLAVSPNTRDSVVLSAWVTDALAHPIPPTKVDNIPKDYILADDGSVSISEISMIIGADQYWNVVCPSVPTISGQPNLVPTRFGYVFHGPAKIIKESSVPPDRHYFVKMESLDENKNEMLMFENVKNLWQLDSLGITNDDKETERFKNCIDHDTSTGRFVAQLPWISDKRPQPNKYQAMGISKSLEKKMSSEELEDYDQQIQKLLDQNVVEVVPKESDPKFYLPHFKEKKRGRIVFNGAVGINTLLNVGPNLLQNLFIVLLQSRMWPCLVQGDIRAAFHQVEIDVQDRDFLTFIWKGKNYRFCRMPFGICSSPAILNECLINLREKSASSYPDTVGKLRIGNYVDDVVSGGIDKKEARTFVDESTEIFEKGGFDLVKWRSYPTDICPESLDEPVQPILGILWDRTTDMYGIKTDVVKTVNMRTRRHLVASVSRVYDPLGILSPWTMRGKELIQRSWKTGLGWDDDLPQDIVDDWRTWASETDDTKVVWIPRLIPTLEGSVVHIFSDASEKAYCASIYLANQNGVFLVSAKTRIAPLKLLDNAASSNITIPRLELLGCLLSVRSWISLEIPCLKDLPIHFWTDSSTCLFYIVNEGLRLKVFERNRVDEIRKTNGKWHHVPGKLNPADVGSRGTSLKKLLNHELWWSGPSFLLPGGTWPNKLDLINVNHSVVNLAIEEIANENENTRNEDDLVADEPIFDLKDVSNLRKALLRTAWVMRFSRNMLGRDAIVGPMSNEELKEAHDYWLIRAQKEHYEQEYGVLSNGGTVKKSSRLIHLHPFMKDGIIFGQPRNIEDPLPILPSDGYFTELVFRSRHADVFHSGAMSTLTSVRQRYHVLKGRNFAKKIVASCQKCKRYRSLPSGAPEGSLPAERCSAARPFSVVGVDYFGPLYTPEKRWVLIFTCGIVRAIHLELVSNGTEEESQLAFRRFIARRGTPRIFISDNAKTFLCLSKEVESHGGTWKFIPEHAPRFGGFYERLIALVKKCLNISFHGVALNDTNLSTILVEIEAAINSRPLTYVSSSQDPLPLTPNDFLHGLDPLENRLDPHVLTDGSQTTIDRLFRARVRITQDFWERFSTEYLQSLRAWNRKGDVSYPPVKPGDVVLVKTPDKRSKWPLGRVLKLIVGRDTPHAASVMIRGVITRRPLDLLFPLECSDQADPSDATHDQADPSDATHDQADPSDERSDLADTPDERNDLADPSDEQNDIDDPFNEQNDDIIVRTKYGRTIKKAMTKDYEYY